MLTSLMEKLAEELTLSELLSSETKGTYLVPLEQDLAIKVSESSAGIYLSCEVAPCPKARREALFTRLLLANLFGQGTHGAILGLNEESNKVLLTCLLDKETDYPAFSDALETFINTIDYWRVEVT